MDWILRMNDSIKYIEDNLQSEIKYEEIARRACCSIYHYQRMFSYMAGIPLSEYIRRRRLTLAAFELQSSNIKVIDIAFKYGYTSPESFTRAFVNMHKVPPSKSRATGVQLTAYPCISFQIFIKGVEKMKYRIVKSEPIKLVGKPIKVDYKDQYERITSYVEQTVIKDINKELLDTYFVYYDLEDEDFKFMTGIEYNGQHVSDEEKVVDIPAANCVVFSIEGMDTSYEQLNTVDNIWKRLGEWFQTNDYEHLKGVPQLEKRFKTDNGYKAEVWIPIK